LTQSANNTAPAQTPVAIIGIGCQFPGARNLKEYWRLLRRGEDAIKDVPPTHWRKNDYVASDPGSADLTYCGRGGFLDPVDFDPARYGIPPTSLEATDTSQLISLMAAQAALEDAGYAQGKTFDRTRTSVILGVTGALELGHPARRTTRPPHLAKGPDRSGPAG
jgi:acyl transferase domain-containing protein